MLLYFRGFAFSYFQIAVFFALSYFLKFAVSYFCVSVKFAFSHFPSSRWNVAVTEDAFKVYFAALRVVAGAFNDCAVVGKCA